MSDQVKNTAYSHIIHNPDSKDVPGGNNENLRGFIDDPFAGSGLSPEAQEIGKLACRGLPARSISIIAGKHRKTVEHHISKIVLWVGVENYRELPNWFISEIRARLK